MQGQGGSAPAHTADVDCVMIIAMESVPKRIQRIPAGTQKQREFLETNPYEGLYKACMGKVVISGSCTKHI